MGQESHTAPFAKGIAAEMELLHELEGEAYWKQLKAITERNEFKPVENGIYSAAGKKNPDFPNLLEASRKAVAQGYRVYILPNPKGFKSADLILERKGFYRMYDVKTISGKASIDNRLFDSIGQSDRVIILLNTNVNPRFLSEDIRKYFEYFEKAKEVIVFKGGKTIVVSRATAFSNGFQARFRKEFTK